MLKWAVTGTNRNAHQQTPRRSVSQRRSVATPDILQDDLARRNRIRRKSSGCELKIAKRKLSICDKENNVTSTPLPGTQIQMVVSPLRKLDTLKDLSNITPTQIESAAKTPKSVASTSQLIQPQYASTLPTFDVEYSPCSVVPGPILALRGMGIADSYFEKPRYFEKDEVEEQTKATVCSAKKPKLSVREEPRTPLSSRSFNMKLFQRSGATSSVLKSFHTTGRINRSVNNTTQLDDESLSSSRMGDVTLDRMIDAILESARKERRVPKSKQTLKCHVMSPTYTPADDPASDLSEFWDKTKRGKLIQRPITKSIPAAQRVVTFEDELIGGTASIKPFNEREVRTPDYFFTKKSETDQQEAEPQQDEDGTSLCLLKRQRAVRRKHKHNANTTSTSSTSQQSNNSNTGKQDTSTASIQQLFDNNSILRKNYEKLAAMDTPKPYGNVSPDSGRNSASDLEESGEDANYNTRRRLWFSPGKIQNGETPT